MTTPIQDVVLAMTPALNTLAAGLNATLQAAMATDFSSPELRRRATAKTRAILASIEATLRETEPIYRIQTDQVGVETGERWYINADALEEEQILHSTNDVWIEIFGSRVLIVSKGYEPIV